MRTVLTDDKIKDYCNHFAPASLEDAGIPLSGILIPEEYRPDYKTTRALPKANTMYDLSMGIYNLGEAFDASTGIDAMPFGEVTFTTYRQLRDLAESKAGEAYKVVMRQADKHGVSPNAIRKSLTKYISENPTLAIRYGLGAIQFLPMLLSALYAHIQNMREVNEVAQNVGQAVAVAMNDVNTYVPVDPDRQLPLLEGAGNTMTRAGDEHTTYIPYNPQSLGSWEAVRAYRASDRTGAHERLPDMRNVVPYQGGTSNPARDDGEL